MRHLSTVPEATGLAEEILGARQRPLVLISSTDDGSFAFDPELVAREVGDDVDVVTIATGDATFALERVLPEKTHAFGGAARAYPPDFGSAPDWWRSLLRFPGRHSVDELIEDALAQVAVVAAQPTPVRRKWVSATVERVSGAAGNVARLDSGERVMVVADHLSPEISLAAGLLVGSPVAGWLSGRDLAPEPADADLSRFEDGTVTLARVLKVTDRRAHLSLHPSLPDITLRRRDIIPGVDDGENADVRVPDIVHPGEIVRVSIVRSGTGVGLSLIGADAGASLVDPLPLLRGGPPWLREGMDAQATPPIASDDDASDVVPEVAQPTHVDRAPAAQFPGLVTSELAALRDEVAELRGAIGRLGRELRAGTDLETMDRLRDEVTSLSAELRVERERRSENGRMISRLNQELREARSSRPESSAGARRTQKDAWPDGEAWVRHEVTSAWAARTVAADKGLYPMVDYAIGSQFVESLEALDEGQFVKALRTVVDVVTGRAADIPARELHRLRQGLGGDDPYVERPDGAKCWRASIETNAPSARRLHYWQLPGGRIELSRIVLHDDFEP